MKHTIKNNNVPKSSKIIKIKIWLVFWANNMDCFWQFLEVRKWPKISLYCIFEQGFSNNWKIISKMALKVPFQIFWSPSEPGSCDSCSLSELKVCFMAPISAQTPCSISDILAFYIVLSDIAQSKSKFNIWKLTEI